MRRLTLLRHAHAAAADRGQDDFARPLDRRGQRQASIIAARAAAAKLPTAAILSSTAVRALSTAGAVASALGLDESAVRAESSLYLASAASLLERVQALDDAAPEVLLCGHNPGLSELAEVLAATPRSGNLPTCALLGLRFEAARWNEIAPRQGIVERYWLPSDEA